MTYALGNLHKNFVEHYVSCEGKSKDVCAHIEGMVPLFLQPAVDWRGGDMASFMLQLLYPS
jgi:hypothetical protein